jgi:Fe-S cluster biogenesis protein NfuA
MDQQIQEVFAKLNSLLGADGSRLTLVEAKGDELVARFEQGQNGECESCVVDADTMEMLVREALANHLPTISKVTLIRN